MAKTKTKPADKPADTAPSWRTLGIDELELSENSHQWDAVHGKGIKTLGELEAVLREYEGTLWAGLNANELNQLIDAVNLAAEDEQDFEELAYVPENAKPADEDDSAPAAAPAAVDLDTVYDPTTPEGLIAYDRQSVALISQAEVKAADAERDYNSAHRVAKARKELFEAANDELRQLIRDRDANRTKKPQPKQKSLLDLKPEATEPASDLWKQYPITAERWERFGLTARDCELMNGGEVKGNSPAFPITTFGDVARFCQPNPNNPSYNRSLADLKGFGEAAVERFAAAQEKFFAWWKEKGEAEYAAEIGHGKPGSMVESAEPAAEGDANEEDEGPEFATVDDYLKDFLKDFAERKNLAGGATDKQIGDAIEFMYGDHGGRSGPGYSHERRKGTWTLEVNGKKEALKGKKLIDRVRTLCNIPQLAN